MRTKVYMLTLVFSQPAEVQLAGKPEYARYLQAWRVFDMFHRLYVAGHWMISVDALRAELEKLDPVVLKEYFRTMQDPRQVVQYYAHRFSEARLLRITDVDVSDLNVEKLKLLG